jgi:hypothetical protein
MTALQLAFEWAWDPGFRGILTVGVAVLILCGSVFLILATNTGNRLGFLIALTGLTGWLTVMGVIWSIYGIGYKGPAPTWKVVDTVRSTEGSGQVDSRVPVARSLPLPDELPDPVEVRDSSPTLLKAYPAEQRDPSLGDLVTVDTELLDQLNAKVKPWRVLETSNTYTGETQAVVAEALGPNEAKVFKAASDYQVIESFLTGGKKRRTDNSTLGRAIFKITSSFDIKPPPLYAVVQLQAVIPQETKPGQAPPPPVRDHSQPIISVVLERTGGHQLRLHAITMTIAMGITTAVLCSMLHRRDKLALAQRAAVAGAGAS